MATSPPLGIIQWNLRVMAILLLGFRFNFIIKRAGHEKFTRDVSAGFVPLA